jgi:hypothetical protein
MKKKCTERGTGSENTAAQTAGGSGTAATGREKGKGKADGPRTTRRDYPEGGRPNPDADSGDARRDNPTGDGEGIDGRVVPSLPRPAAGAAAGEAAIRDIITKAAEGDINYQKLYLKYIDLISGKMVDENEVIYEATFIDDEDHET